MQAKPNQIKPELPALPGKRTREPLTTEQQSIVDGFNTTTNDQVTRALAERRRTQPPHTSVSLTDKQRVKDAGYIVERFGDKGWTLCGPDDPSAPLMVGSHGCVSPTAWECFAEAIKRIEQDERLLADDAGRNLTECVEALDLAEAAHAAREGEAERLRALAHHLHEALAFMRSCELSGESGADHSTVISALEAYEGFEFDSEN